MSQTVSASNRRKGIRGERQIEKRLRKAGWRAGPQCGSGAFGTRIASLSKQGDLWAQCGDARLRIEVKHYKHEPRALQTLRAGSDILAYICSTTGKTALFLDEAIFWDLMAWSAEAMQCEPEAEVQRRRLTRAIASRSPK